MNDIDKLVNDNIGLAYHNLKYYKGYDRAAAESAALGALLTAANTYDDSKGYAFSTYATVCIRNALYATYNSIDKRHKDTLSLQTTIGITDNERTVELMDLVDNGLSVEDKLINKYTNGAIRESMQEAFDNLPQETNKKVIYIWLMHDMDISATAISKQVGVSASYASTIIKRFMASVRRTITRRQLL